MIIAIDLNAANDAEAILWLDRLLGRIEDGWHLWDVTGAEAYGDTMWVTGDAARGRRIMDLYRKAVERSAWSQAPHGRRIRVTLQPDNDGQLAPEPAFRLADERLVVLVENRQSDGAFLHRVFQELDPASPPLGRERF